MATFSRAKNARPNGLVPGFAGRDAIPHQQNVHLKPSELQLLFRCSRSIAGKLMKRADFPAPFDLTGDGNNLRYALDEVLAWRNNHRREIRLLKAPPRTARPIALPPAAAEAAVRKGLAALREDRAAKKGDPTGFR
jgi:predicted DNA-binding transcriptional regulator AlpA